MKKSIAPTPKTNAPKSSNSRIINSKTLNSKNANDFVEILKEFNCSKKAKKDAEKARTVSCLLKIR